MNDPRDRMDWLLTALLVLVVMELLVSLLYIHWR